MGTPVAMFVPAMAWPCAARPLTALHSSSVSVVIGAARRLCGQECGPMDFIFFKRIVDYS
jgi:hypothetical protein